MNRTSHSTPRTCRIAVAAVLAILLTMVGPGYSQTWTQPATGAASNWSAGPWDPAPPVSSPTTAVVLNVLAGRSGYTFTNDVAGGFTLNSLTINDYSTNTLTLALGSNPVTFGGTNPALNYTGPGLATITGTNAFVLGSNLTFGGNGLGTLTISSAITETGGARGITINQGGLGIVSLTGTNTFTGGVTLTNGYLSLGSAAALGASTNALTINGGALRFTTTSTIPNPITASSTMVVTGATSTPVLTGVISGAGGIRLQHYNTATGLTLQAANTYTGATVLQSYVPNSTQSGPVLTLSGANGAIASSSAITLGKNTQVTIGGTTANANRIGDTTPFTVDNAIINYVPVTAGTNEAVGNLSVTGGIRFTTTAAGLSNLQFGSFSRTDNAVMWLTSNTFGTINDPALATNITFTSGLSTASNVSAGAQTQIGIIPFAIAGSSTNPRSFVTYDATNGLTVVPYTNATYVFTSTQANFASDLTAGNLTNKNVHLSGAGNYDLGGGSLTVNAITTTSSTVNIRNGTLNIVSGTFVNWDSVIFDTGATLNFPSTGYIHQSYNNVFRDTATITGANGLVVGGYQTGVTTGTLTFENTPGNNFSGGLFINGMVAVGFRQDNQLGAAGGAITLSGGGLAYNNATDLTSSRPIKINGTGYVTFNRVATGGSTATPAVATTVLTLSGPITGTGALVKEGVGILNLTGTNTYSGGTVVSAGTLQFTADNNLGSVAGKLILNGGTLQPLAAGTIARPIEINANSTILNNVDVTVSNSLTAIGQQYGTANATLSKAGTGTLTISGNHPNLSGVIAATAGNIRLTGSLPQLSAVSVAGGTFTIDNTAANGSRLSALSSLNMNGGELVLQGNAAGTTQPLGVLNLVSGTSATNKITVIQNGAPAFLDFSNFVQATNIGTLFRGNNLGGNTGAFTRIRFTTAPTLVNNLIPGSLVDTTATGDGTGATGGGATYDATADAFGVIGVKLVPTFTGTLIDNNPPTNTPTSAFFTTSGNTTVNGPASIGALTVNNTATVTINPTYGAASLTIAAGNLTSTSTPGGSTIGPAGSSLIFPAGNNILTNTDLTILSKLVSSTIVKNGTAKLTVSDPGTIDNFTLNAGTLGLPNGMVVNNFSGVAGTTIDLAPAGVFNYTGTAAITFPGVIVGTGGSLQKSGFLGATTGSVLTLQGANTYTGPTTVNIGGLTLDSSGTLAATSALTIGRVAGNIATVTVNNGTTNVANRVSDTATVNFAGGYLAYTSGAYANTETFGPVNVNSFGVISAANNASQTSAVLTMGNFSRSDNFSQIFFNGPIGGGTAVNSVNLSFTNGATALGLLLDPAATGTGAVAISPFAAGFRTSGTTTLVRSFVTYDTANNTVRVLDLGATATDFAQVAAASALVPNVNNALNGSPTALAGDIQVNALAVPSTSTISGSGNLTVFSGAVAVYLPLTLSGPTLNFPSGRTGFISLGDNLIVSGTSSITGNAGLVVGSNTTSYSLQLNNTVPNPFTGGLYINGVTNVNFNADDNQLGAAGQPVNLRGGTLNYTGSTAISLTNGTTPRPITTNALGGTISVSSSSTAILTVPGVVSGVGYLGKAGAGTLVLANAANTYSGGTLITAGTVSVAADGALGAAPASPSPNIYLSGGTLDASASITLNANRTIALGAFNGTGTGNLSAQTGTTLTIAGVIANNGPTGVGTFAKQGPGILALTGANTFTGGATVSAGTIRFSGTGSAAQAGSLTLAANTSVIFDNVATNVNDRYNNVSAVALGAGAELSLLGNSAGTNEILGALSATGAGARVTLTSAGSLPTTLTFASLGSVTSPSTLLIRGSNLGGTTGAYTRVLFTTPPTLVGGLIPNVTYDNSPTGTGLSDATYDAVRGIIPANTFISGNLIDNNAPTSTPTNAIFTTTGATTVNGPATITSLILDNTPAGVTINNTYGAASFTLTSQNGTITTQGANSSIGPAGTSLILNATAVINANTDLNILSNATSTGAGNLTKNGAGKLTLSGTGTNLPGAYTINAGTLTLPNNTTIASLTGATGTTLELPGSTLTINGTASTTFAGAIVGANGRLVKTTGSTGTLTLQGNNTYSGTTLISGATPGTGTTSQLTLSGAAGRLANTSAITIDSNATLAINQSTTTGGVLIGRLPATSPISSLGGRFSYQSGTGGPDPITENFGPFTARGLTAISNPVTTGGPTTGTAINFGNLTTIEKPTFFVRGTVGGNPAATNINVYFANGMNAIFDPTAPPGNGNVAVVPFIGAATGGAAAFPTTLATYDATNGITVLSPTDSANFAQIGTGGTFDAFTNALNVHLTATQSYPVNGSQRVNSLAASSATTTITAGTPTPAILTVYSGAIINYNAMTFDAVTLDFGANTGYFHQGDNVNINTTSSITGTGGVVASSFSPSYALNFANTVANPFTGGLFINGNGGVRFLNDNQLGAAGGSVTLNGGTLTYNGAAATTGTVSRSVVVGLVGGGLSAANATSVLQISGTGSSLNAGVGGAGPLNISGGIVDLAQSSTSINGPVTVSAGTLRANTASGVSATGSGPVTVASGGTLGGTGFILPATGNAVTVNGTIAPGNAAIGTLTVGSSSTPSSLVLNGTYLAEVSNTPNSSDRIALFGNLTLGSASVLNLPTTNTYDPVANNTIYSLITYTGSLNGVFSSVTNLPTGYVINYGTVVGNTITLQPIPEPASILAVCAMSAGAVTWYRRRRQQRETVS